MAIPPQNRRVPRRGTPARRGRTVQVPVFRAPVFTAAYVLEPGTASNNVSTPHNVAFNPAGDLTIVVRVALDDWTPTAQQTLASKRGATIADASWRLAIAPSGKPLLAVSVDGIATTTATSAVALAPADGTAIWLRATRVSSTGLVGFYYAADQSAIPTVWTNLSVGQATTAGALNASTADIHIGGYSAGTLESAAGKFFQVVEIGGAATTDTQLFNMNPSDWRSGTTWVSAATGETWTINGTASVVPQVSTATLAPRTISRRRLALPLRRRSKVAWTPPIATVTVTATYVPPIQRRTRVLPRLRRGFVTSAPPTTAVVVTATFVPQIARPVRRLLPRRRGLVTSVPKTVVVRVPQVISARRNRLGLRQRRGLVLNTITATATGATLALEDSGVGSEGITISVDLTVTEGAITSEQLHPNKTGKNTLLSVKGYQPKSDQAAPPNDEPGV